MPGILDEKLSVMALLCAMVKHDSLDKAPLNDEVLSKSSTVGTSLNHTKCTIYHVPEHRSCQVISQWMQASYAIKLLCVIVYCTPGTSDCFHFEI